MRFSCNKTDINKAVSAVSRIIGSQITMPVFSNIYIDATDSTVRFCGSDNELFMRYTVNAAVERDGQVTVNASYFAKAISAANSAPVDNLIIDVGADFKGVIDVGKGKDKFMASSAEAYIIPEKMASDVRIDFSSEELKELIDKTKICVSKDDTKPNIKGICISVANGKIKFVSTDTRRLALVERDYEFDREFEITVPAKCINEIGSIISTLNAETIAISFNERQIMFACANFELTSRLIGERFPDYREVIPQTYKLQAEVNTSTFKNAVEYIMHNAENNAFMVKIEIGANNMIFSARSRDTSTDSIYEIECVRSGEESQNVAVIFNALYLREIFRVIDTETAVLQVVGALQPCIIRPYNSNDIYIVMPVRSE